MSDPKKTPDEKPCEPWLDESKIDRRSAIKWAGTVAFGMAASSLLPTVSQSQVPPESTSTLIKDGYVISVDKKIGDIEKGDVLIKQGTISAIGKNLRASNAQIVDASSKLILPGFVDAHAHTWARITRAHVEMDYWNVLEKKLMLSYRSDDLYIASLLCCLEMLNAGITAVWDYAHAMHDDEVADGNIRGLRDSGIRGVFGWGLPHVAVSPTALDGARRIKAKYFSSPSEDELITFGVSTRLGEPYPYQWPTPPGIGNPFDNAVHDLRLGREIGVKRIHMHATFKPEMARGRLVTRLHDAKLLGPDITFVHANFVTEDEIEMMADSGAAVVVCQNSETPSTTQRFLRHGVMTGVGDDAGTTRSPINLGSSMRMMVQNDFSLEHQRAREEGGTTTMLTYGQVLEAATIGSARAVGLGDKVGSLTLGKRADVIVIDLDNISLLPLDKDSLASIIMQVQPSDVSWVFVDGQVRKREGKLVGIDHNRLRSLAEGSYEYLCKKADLPRPRVLLDTELG
jgi:5-methylthioadenosine/S-adenosylhomocysteine deaminase